MIAETPDGNDVFVKKDGSKVRDPVDGTVTLEWTQTGYRPGVTWTVRHRAKGDATWKPAPVPASAVTASGSVANVELTVTGLTSTPVMEAELRAVEEDGVGQDACGRPLLMNSEAIRVVVGVL